MFLLCVNFLFFARVAFGGVAFGGVAFGGVAFGGVAFGGVAFGGVAFGGHLNACNAAFAAALILEKKLAIFGRSLRLHEREPFLIILVRGSKIGVRSRCAFTVHAA